jgi:hypothetical protein
MTTRVTVINESAKDGPDQHIVLIKKNGQIIGKAYPGERVTQIHVWANSPLTIEEAPLA